LYGGRVRSFDVNLKDLFQDLPGMSGVSKFFFIKRFELSIFKKKKKFTQLRLENRKIINMYLSHIVSINNSIDELVRYNLIRLYLIKTQRGRAQAIGKPSRGQRT
jgi:ribosomal protein S13